MSKLQELIDRLCPHGVEFRPLGEVVELLDSQRKPVSKGKRKEGIYPYYGANGIQDYVDAFIFDGTFLLIGEDGSVINPDKSPVLNWAEGKIWVNNHAHILKETEIANLRFIFYALQVTDVSDIVRGTPPKLNQANLKGIKIPIPPIEVQEEIVRILDTFSAHAAELQAELQARKEQYEYYRNLLLSFNPSASDDEPTLTTWGGHSYKIAWKPMGEIGKFIRGNGLQKKDFTDSGVGCIHYGQIYTHYGTFATETKSYVSHDFAKKLRKAKYGDLIIATTSENVEDVGKAVAWLGKDEIAVSGDSSVFSHKQNPKYIAYLLQTHRFLQFKRMNVSGTKVTRISGESLEKYRIPIPPLELQEKIVAILDRFETLVNDLTQGLPAEIAAVREQYEYNRNKLLTFKQLA